MHTLAPYSSLARLVVETLGPLPPDRKCFRMINGVLVERTVQDVMPALVTNSDGLKKVLEDLVKQYKRQQEEMEKWKVGFRPCVANHSLTSSAEVGIYRGWGCGFLLTPLMHFRRRIMFKLCNNDRLGLSSSYLQLVDDLIRPDCPHFHSGSFLTR